MIWFSMWKETKIELFRDVMKRDDEINVLENVCFQAHIHSAHSADTLINKHCWLNCHAARCERHLLSISMIVSLLLSSVAVCCCWLLTFFVTNSVSLIISVCYRSNTLTGPGLWIRQNFHVLSPNFHSVFTDTNLRKLLLHTYLYNNKGQKKIRGQMSKTNATEIPPTDTDTDRVCSKMLVTFELIKNCIMDIIKLRFLCFDFMLKLFRTRKKNFNVCALKRLDISDNHLKCHVID